MTTSFTEANLPDVTKEALCRSLLGEFGVGSISTGGDGELKHCCALPWHDEKHPSASLNYKKLVYRCLGCDAKGGLLWFIATCRDVPGKEARTWLSNQTGLGPEFNLSALLDLIKAINAGTHAKFQPIPRMSATVLRPWQVIHPYLTENRRVPEQNIIDLDVGYAEKYKVSDDQISKRIILPHFWKGDLVGWQSRRIYNDGTPKYLSTGDFPKDKTIYNYDPDRPYAVVVESPLSVLRHYHHVPMEATFGASITQTQARIIGRHRKVILFMDNDLAGWQAIEGHYLPQKHGRPPKLVSQGLVERLAPYCDLWIVNNPWAADPGDMDDETVESLVDTAVPYAAWKRPKQLREWEVK